MFRRQIQDKMTKTSSIMKKLQLDLSEFDKMYLPYEKEVSKLNEISVHTFWSETKKSKVYSTVKWLLNLDGKIQDCLPGDRQ